MPLKILGDEEHWEPSTLEWVSDNSLAASYHYVRDQFARFKFIKIRKNEAIEKKETVWREWTRFIYYKNKFLVITKNGNQEVTIDLID